MFLGSQKYKTWGLLCFQASCILHVKFAISYFYPYPRLYFQIIFNREENRKSVTNASALIYHYMLFIGVLLSAVWPWKVAYDIKACDVSQSVHVGQFQCFCPSLPVLIRFWKSPPFLTGVKWTDLACKWNLCIYNCFHNLVLWA